MTLTSFRTATDYNALKICSDILYRPVALLNCLHTFCGSCAKLWFRQQADQDAGGRPARRPRFTCPVCREQVRGSNRDTRAASLVEWFLGQYPEKSRSDDEKREMDQRYRPNDEVLPRVGPLAIEQQRLAEQEMRGADAARRVGLNIGAQQGNVWQAIDEVRQRIYLAPATRWLRN